MGCCGQGFSSTGTKRRGGLLRGARMAATRSQTAFQVVVTDRAEEEAAMKAYPGRLVRRLVHGPLMTILFFS